MHLKETFNLDPTTYDNMRPSYPQALYQDLMAYSGLIKGDKCLEVGIGTGQATGPFLQAGCQVTAVELGPDLAAFSRKKFAAYDHFDLIEGSFESADLASHCYDLVYAASSFHWIPLDQGLEKVKTILRPGGTFAWISVQPGPDPSHRVLHEKIQDVYYKYRDHFPNFKSVKDLDYLRSLVDNKLENRKKDFERHSFTDVKTLTFKGQRRLSARDYCRLLSTYSDHKAMGPQVLQAFLGEVEGVIEAAGGYFLLSDTHLMCIGRTHE